MLLQDIPFPRPVEDTIESPSWHEAESYKVAADALGGQMVVIDWGGIAKEEPQD